MSTRTPPSIPTALHKPLVVCLVALTAAATLVIASHQSHRNAEDTHRQLATRLDDIHRKHEEALKNTTDARLALRQMADLQRLGLKPPMSRLRLTGEVDAALTGAGLADINYTLQPAQPLGDVPLLTQSTLRLSGSAPHEARLLAALRQLETTGQGLFLPLRCALSRTATDAHTIVKADCEAIWLGLQAPV